MDFNLRYSPAALEDLEEIWNYISQNLCNITAAQNPIDGIINSIDLLKDFPKSGKKLEFSNGLTTAYRFVQYHNYLAFYRILDSDIFIDRILYGKRDYLKILSSTNE